MIRFNSFLAKYFEAFLKYRRQTGYLYGRLRWHLSTLDQYLAERNACPDDLTPGFLLDFRSQLNGEPGTANRVFIVLNAFFDYLMRMEIMKSNPAEDIPQLPENSYIPFVFSSGRVDLLLKRLQQNIRKTDEALFLSGLGAYSALFLMARCGMRISEPLRLKESHYRPEEKSVYIEKTKFNKDRLIPVPDDAAAAIENFLSVKKAVFGEKAADPLLRAHRGPVSKGLIYRAFHQAVKEMEINQPKQTIGDVTFGHPRPHSLRHSFAVNTLKSACEKGRDPENVLPVLAAYMGHSDYRYTMKYLKVIDADHLNGWVNFCIFKRDKG